MRHAVDGLVVRAMRPGVAAVLTIALAPYATVLLPFRTALWLQGIAIMAIVAALLAAGARTVPRRWLAAPVAVRWGLGLYAGAALWGAAVAFASGNPVHHVATQLASMLLLPAAFLAFSAGRGIAAEELAGGLAVAAGIALAVHLAAILGVDALQPPAGEPVRLYLRNDVGLTGAAVVGFLVATAWWRNRQGWRPCVAMTLLGVFAVGGMSRGAWFAVGTGLVVWAIISGLVSTRLAVRLLLVALVVLGAVEATGRWIGERSLRPVEVDLPVVEVPSLQTPPGGGRVRLVADAGADRRQVSLLRGLPFDGRAVEVDLRLLGGEDTAAIMTVTGEHQGEATRARFRVEGCDTWVPLQVVQFLPAGTRLVDVDITTDRGRWLVTDPRVHVLDTATATWLRALRLRMAATVTALTTPAADPTLRYRWREWQAIRARWGEAGLGRLLAGQGLGATFNFRNGSFDDRGRRIMLPTASYIHNYYVFLAFKLGLTGFVALAGIGLLVGWTLARGVRERAVANADWLAAAAAAVWFAYLTWDLTSPEILDFRAVPLLGALLAATLRRITESSGGAVVAGPVTGAGGTGESVPPTGKG
jgi:hypothetical protein